MSLNYRYQAPPDDGVDPIYELVADGADTGIYIQDCRGYGGGLMLGRHFHHPKEGFCMEMLGEFRSLTAAQNAGIVHFNARD